MNENKKKNRALWLRLISLTIAVLLPFAVMTVLMFSLPNAYKNTFMGEMADKYNNITDKKDGEERIIVVGGSSVAFGIDSSMIEETLNKKVINFGLYADLGTKIMLDLSIDSVGKGDLIVLAPELDSQTLSMYFKAESAWQAIGGNFSMLKHIRTDNYADLAGEFIGYVGNLAKYAISGTVLNPDGIYRKDSFNAYGDISAERPYNVMTIGYDPNQTISLTPDIFDPEFVEYVNQYIADAEAKGAEVVFDFCPMNSSAMAEDTTDESLQAFYRYVCENIRCQVIGNVEESIMDWGYFYDTNYHLNDAGVKVHTYYLIDDIMRYYGKTDVLHLELPEAPGMKPVDEPDAELPESEWAKYFVYEDFGKNLQIVGVTDEAKTMTSLEIPEAHDNKKVLILKKNALDGCSALTELTIREALTLIEDGALNGCSSLKTIHMRREDSDSLEAGTELFSGTNANIVIKLYTETSYDNFANGYWWAYYLGSMEYVKGE